MQVSRIRINVRLPKAIIAILRIEVEEGGTLRLILRIITIVDSSAVSGFLFHVCGKKNNARVDNKFSSPISVKNFKGGRLDLE